MVLSRFIVTIQLESFLCQETDYLKHCGVRRGCTAMMPVDASQYYSTCTLLWSIKHHAWVHSILVSMFMCRQKYSDIHCICICCLPRGKSGYCRSFIHILWGIVNQSTFIPDQTVRTIIHLDEIIIVYRSVLHLLQKIMSNLYSSAREIMPWNHEAFLVQFQSIIKL